MTNVQTLYFDRKLIEGMYENYTALNLYIIYVVCLNVGSESSCVTHNAKWPE